MATGSRSALINRAIPSFFQGVSQQPATLRLASQSEVVDNAYPTLVDGLRKRPPAIHVGRLNTQTINSRFTHFINRDAVERYVVLIEDGDLKVYDLNGNTMTVNFPSGKAYLNTGGALARENFAAVTIADFTFIANKTITVAMGAGVAPNTLTGTVQRFTSLPGSPVLNQVFRIEGDNTNSFDTMYVRWNGSVWQEVARPGEINQINSATMPHRLVRTGVNTFEFSPITWATRNCGDLTITPNPSFVGQRIRDIFLHRNRLGVCAGESVVLSSSPASEFRFFRESMAAVLDTDPIDTGASANKVATLQYAVPFDKSLLLFSEQNQFILGGTTTLTPRTATIDNATDFESSSKCRPVAAGNNVYFVTPRGNWAAVREYFVDNEVLSTDATEVTSHVPTFLPSNIVQLEPANNDDAVFAISDSALERNKIFAYKYYWQAQEKVQSAWVRWVFSSDTVVLGLGMVGTRLYFVCQRADGTYLEYIDVQAGLTEPGMEFLVHIDRRMSLTGVYDSANNWTTWTLPVPVTGAMAVVYGPGFGLPAGKGLNNVTRPTTTTVRAPGNHAANPCFVGVNYEMVVSLSEQVVRDSQTSSIQDGSLKLRRMLLNYSNSGFFIVEVTPEARNTYSYKFTGNVIGAAATILGKQPIITGAFKFGVQTDSRGVSIVIRNPTHLPSTFLSAEWIGLFTPKSTR
jgi:hypothetical protein